MIQNRQKWGQTTAFINQETRKNETTLRVIFLIVEHLSFLYVTRDLRLKDIHDYFLSQQCTVIYDYFLINRARLSSVNVDRQKK